MRRFKKVFSCVIVVISFVLLFFSWTMLTPRAKTETVDYYNAVFKPEKEETDFTRVMGKLKRLDLQDYLGSGESIEKVSQFVEEVFRQSGLKGLIGALEDGGMDVSQTALAARTMRNVYTGMYDAESLFDLNDETLYIKNTGALAVYETVVTVLFILAILAAIATFAVRFFDRFAKYRKYDLIFFIIQLLLFIMTIIFVGSINTYFKGFPVLGVSLWGILAVIFACPSVFLDKIPVERAYRYTAQGVAMNETAYAFSDGISKTVDRISNKMDETAQGVRLTRDLRANEELLHQKYAVLGKQFFEENSEEPPESMRESFEEINEMRNRIDTIRRDIDAVNNVVACPSCGKRWDVGTKFCANCGAMLPVINEDKEEFDYEMKQRKEKKAGKSFCKYCGAKVEEDDDFCPGCGRSI